MFPISASRWSFEKFISDFIENKTQNNKITKTIIKNKKNEKITWMVVVVCMISIVAAIQSCSNEQIDNLSVNKVQI